jgi:hypothetical protein
LAPSTTGYQTSFVFIAAAAAVSTIPLITLIPETGVARTAKTMVDRGRGSAPV